MAGLSNVAAAKLRVGNCLAEFTTTGARIAHRAQAANVVENPWRSYLWLLEWTSRMKSELQSSTLLVDYCAFMKPWQKRTRLESTLYGLGERLPPLCTGHRRCSFTNRCHIRLKGKLDGRYLTKLAEPYPMGLCNIVANLVVDAVARGWTIGPPSQQ